MTVETLGPGPLRARTTAEKIDAGGAVLGKGVDGEMRFGERHQARNATRCRKDVPDCLGDGRELQLAYDGVEQGSESGKMAQQYGRAATRVHNPLATVGERHRRR